MRHWVPAGIVGLLVCAISLVRPCGASAQEAALRDSLLDRMVGHWILRGTIEGQPTTHDVDADWVLGHGYLRVHEVSRERNADGSPVYEAIVMVGVDPGAPGYACFWLDNTSARGLNGQAMGHADPAAGDSIAFVFKGADGSAFHTTFHYERARDLWTWAMDGEGAGGGRLPFARLTLSRQ
jgi:hypothetical protein